MGSTHYLFFQFWYRFDYPCANSKSEFSMTYEGFATLPTLARQVGAYTSSEEDVTFE